MLSAKLGGRLEALRLQVEGTVGMEYRVRITLRKLGHSEADTERVLDAWLATHPEVGPMVSSDTRTGELSITLALEAEDARNAYERSTPLFLESMDAAGVALTPAVGLEVVAVEAEEQGGEARPPELEPA